MKVISEEYNPATGITTQYLLQSDGNIRVRGLQDVDPILDHNQKVLNSKNAKSSKLNESEGLGTKVASIPTVLVEKLRVEKGINLLTCSTKDLHRILNDPDYRKLRTAHGRL